MASVAGMPPGWVRFSLALQVPSSMQGLAAVRGSHWVPSMDTRWVPSEVQQVAFAAKDVAAVFTVLRHQGRSRWRHRPGVRALRRNLRHPHVAVVEERGSGDAHQQLRQ